MKFKTYGQLSLATAILGFLGMSCSHAPVGQPYDSIVVDRSNPDHTVVVLNGVCGPAASAKENVNSTTESRQPGSVTQDGKTYYFSNDSDRDRFFEAHAINSRY
jgi:hypothetical protein